MRWIAGNLEVSPYSASRLALLTGDRQVEFHCGDRLEVHLDGRWQRGRVEFSDRRGWYFTDNERSLSLHPGDTVRIWDGREWPRTRDDDFGRSR